MTLQLDPETSTSFIGPPILSSTTIVSSSSQDGSSLPLPSFLTNPVESDDEDTPQPQTPNLSDYQLPTFLLNSAANNTQNIQLSALLSDDLPAASINSSSTTPTLTFIKGRKGGDQACYGGYIYTYDRKKDDGTIYWQCKTRASHSPRCKGRLYTNGKMSVKRHTPHSHEPSERAVLRSTTISNIKYDSSTSTPGNVLRERLISTPVDIKAILPAPHNLKRQIRSYRAKHRIAPSTVLLHQ